MFAILRGSKKKFESRNRKAKNYISDKIKTDYKIKKNI